MSKEKIDGEIQAFTRVMKFIDNFDPNRESMDFQILKNTIRIWLDLLENKPIEEDTYKLKELYTRISSDSPAKLN